MSIKQTTKGPTAAKKAASAPAVPWFCKTTHSDGLVYTQVALTAVFAITGVVLMALKHWKLAYIFISSAVFSGIGANTTLQIRLNTDSCHDQTKQILYGVCSFFTATGLISWALLSLHLINIVNLETGKKTTAALTTK